MEDSLRCDKCNSSQTFHRVKTNDRICYKCGNIFTKSKELKKRGKN